MAFGDVSSIYDLYGPRASFEAGIGTFGTNYADPYQQYLTRNFDDLNVLYDRRANLATAGIGNYSQPAPFLGSYARGLGTPLSVQNQARQQFQTALSLGVNERQDVGLGFGGGAIPTLLRQSSRGRLPRAAI